MNRLREIQGPDIKFNRVLTPVNPPEQPLRFIDRFPEYHSILLDKQPEMVYNYHGIFSRILYTRTGLQYLPGVFPQITNSQ